MAYITTRHTFKIRNLNKVQKKDSKSTPKNTNNYDNININIDTPNYNEITLKKTIRITIIKLV